MEEVLTDDQSHYEISLTAGQAFVAFVLLLLSLAASFAFGLLIGRGQADDRLVMRKDSPVISEAAAVPAKKMAKEPRKNGRRRMAKMERNTKAYGRKKSKALAKNHIG